MSAPSSRQDVLASLNVSRETAERLSAYVDLLKRWQTRINLVAASTVDDIWSRHILDSAQLLAIAQKDARRWVDLGTGAGLPGAVLAILLADRPGAEVHLVEANQKKAAFLAEAVRITRAPAKVYADRIERIVGLAVDECDVVTARALAPLPDLLRLSSPLLMKGAQGLFLKGRDVEAELTEAAKSWTMRAELFPSQTDSSGRIVSVTVLAPRLAN
ncbi:MAG: 16S rRNA (guanine(527)-N(7))-methyltransferase RsmG [Rhizobiales bacterium]|nr:16S rRNA (guanine(527)-N(7))-methyltransferase RsmG [Hyphomicrobiales bacterium]